MIIWLRKIPSRTAPMRSMALKEALKAYLAARAAWEALAAKAEGVYVSDITFGRAAHLRGHWKDRLKALVR